jgi:hypothetical protein
VGLFISSLQDATGPFVTPPAIEIDLEQPDRS